MKKWLVTFSLFFSVSALGLESKIISENEVSAYLYHDVTVCGLIKQVKSTANATYFNLGGIYPNQKVTFLIWAENRLPFLNKFGNLNMLQNKYLCAKGYVSEYKGKPQIVLTSTDLLRFTK